MHVFLQEFMQENFSIFSSGNIRAHFPAGFYAGIFVYHFLHVFLQEFLQENFSIFFSGNISARFSVGFPAGIPTREIHAGFFAHFHIISINLWKSIKLTAILDPRFWISHFWPRIHAQRHKKPLYIHLQMNSFKYINFLKILPDLYNAEMFVAILKFATFTSESNSVPLKMP